MTQTYSSPVYAAVFGSALLQAALSYLEHGFSVLPVDGKKASIIWTPYQDRHPTEQEIRNWWPAGTKWNIAIVCGTVSRLVVLDLDGKPAVDEFESEFPSYCATFTVLTGSGRGKHIYLRPSVIPRTLRIMGIKGIGNIEMRSDGSYVVAPPSIHPDTHQRYQVERALPILEVPNLDDVQTWMQGFLPRKSQSFRTPAWMPTEKAGRAIRFAEAALTSEICAVRSAVTGNRNNQLNRAAYSLGQLVADGLLSHDKVESALLSAALDAGLGEAEAWRTIQSGLRAGLRNPRSRRHG